MVPVSWYWRGPWSPGERGQIAGEAGGSASKGGREGEVRRVHFNSSEASIPQKWLKAVNRAAASTGAFSSGTAPRRRVLATAWLLGEFLAGVQ